MSIFDKLLIKNEILFDCSNAGTILRATNSDNNSIVGIVTNKSSSEKYNLMMFTNNSNNISSLFTFQTLNKIKLHKGQNTFTLVSPLEIK